MRCPVAHPTTSRSSGRYHTTLCSLGASCKRKACFLAHHHSELRAAPAEAGPQALAAAAAPSGAAQRGLAGACTGPRALLEGGSCQSFALEQLAGVGEQGAASWRGLVPASALASCSAPVMMEPALAAAMGLLETQVRRLA